VTSVTSVRCSPRCAYFSPNRHDVTDRISPTNLNLIPLRDLRDLRAMLSPLRLLSRPTATNVTDRISPTNLNPHPPP
jgi:hypothetical protein